MNGKENLDNFSSKESPKLFEVIPARDGYKIYFSSLEAARQAIIDFWSNRNPKEAPGWFASGMWIPEHQLTAGDRTDFHQKLLPHEVGKYPGMVCSVWFHGNDYELTAKGNAALQSLGFIE